jgi:hypothetical protein
MTSSVKRETKHAVLYFDSGNSSEFKDLASRVRSEGGKTTLVWSDRWNGPENLMMEARAVIIQKDCFNAQLICDAYRKYANDVEIHFVNSLGEFEEEEGSDDTEAQADISTETDTAVQEDSEVDSDDDSGDTEAEGTDDAEVPSTGDEAGQDRSSSESSDALDRLED